MTKDPYLKSLRLQGLAEYLGFCRGLRGQAHLSEEQLNGIAKKLCEKHLPYKFYILGWSEGMTARAMNSFQPPARNPILDIPAGPNAFGDKPVSEAAKTIHRAMAATDRGRK